MPVTITARDGGRNPKINFTTYRLSLPEAARDAVDASAKVMTRIIQAGAPARLSGVGKNGASLGIRQHKSGSFAQPQTVLKASGPWQLIEHNTRPHIIVSRKLGGSRRRRTNLASGLFVRASGRRVTTTRRGERGAIRTPQGLRAYAQHPGTRGKHVWKKGVERGTPAATLAFAKVMRTDLKRQFG